MVNNNLVCYLPYKHVLTAEAHLLKLITVFFATKEDSNIVPTLGT